MSFRIPFFGKITPAQKAQDEVHELEEHIFLAQRTLMATQGRLDANRQRRDYLILAYSLPKSAAVEPAGAWPRASLASVQSLPQ